MPLNKINTLQKILVPVDFSSFSDSAIALALNLPESRAAELHLVHVIPPGNLAFESARTINERNRQASLQLQQCLGPQIEIEREICRDVREGLPHVEICEYASRHNIDLIVMGTCGQGGVRHLLLGSVAERVLRQAACPVLVLRTPTAQTPDSKTETSTTSNDVELETSQKTSPAIDLIQRAIALRATDIHVDPVSTGKFLVRLRIDGWLESYCELNEDIAEHLIHQFQNLAHLDIANPFHPQEGRLTLPSTMCDLEVRLTAAPVAGGQAVALRLFDREQVLLPLSRLGLEEHSYTAVQHMLQREEGLILVTGPTGAGKTTTVYSMLQTLRDHQQNIVSIEDPVEFEAPFIRQMAVDARHGITLSSGLRTMLRMDPDILFLGEIRDGQAANMAMQAASSGKYVFSTLHTRDVAATITALRDLKIDNRSLAENLRGIINQRLVRRLCPACLQQQAIRDELSGRFDELQITSPERVAEPQGCAECRETGYRGRVGVFEVAVIDDSIREAISQQISQQALREVIRTAGVRSLESDAFAKVRDGATSYQEARQIRWL